MSETEETHERTAWMLPGFTIEMARKDPVFVERMRALFKNEVLLQAMALLNASPPSQMQPLPANADAQTASNMYHMDKGYYIWQEKLLALATLLKQTEEPPETFEDPTATISPTDITP